MTIPLPAFIKKLIWSFVQAREKLKIIKEAEKLIKNTRKRIKTKLKAAK